MAILDPPLVQYAIFQHPEWKLKQVPGRRRSRTNIRSCQRNTTSSSASTRTSRSSPKRSTRAIKTGLEGLPEREDHGQVWPGRQGVVHPAREEPAHRGRPGRKTTRPRPPIIASEPQRASQRTGIASRSPSSRRQDTEREQRRGRHGSGSRCSELTICTRASASSRFCAASISMSRAARRSRSSDRAVPARRRCCAASTTSRSRVAGTSTSTAR